MPVYIEKINGDVDRPTDRPTNQPTNRANIEQSAFSKFETLEKRQRFAICAMPENFMIFSRESVTDLFAIKGLAFHAYCRCSHWKQTELL